MFGYIYKTTNLINNKIYIGQHKAETFECEQYKGSGTLLNRAIRKYGKENFVTELLKECSSKEELNEREIYYIDKYNSTNIDIGYNIAAGGGGGSGPRSDETKKAISDFVRNSFRITDGVNEKVVLEEELQEYIDKGYYIGRKPFRRTDSFKMKQSELNRNKVGISKDGIRKRVYKSELDSYLSEGWVIGWSQKSTRESLILGEPTDSKKSMFDGCKYHLVYSSIWEQKLSEGWIFKGPSKGKGRISPTKGKQLSLETRKKLSESHKGKSQSKEAIEKQRLSLLGRVYMHKDGVNRLIPKGEEFDYQSKGWKYGKVCGKIWVTDLDINKLIDKEDLSYYLNIGFQKGTKSKIQMKLKKEYEKLKEDISVLNPKEELLKTHVELSVEQLESLLASA